MFAQAAYLSKVLALIPKQDVWYAMLIELKMSPRELRLILSEWNLPLSELI